MQIFSKQRPSGPNELKICYLFTQVSTLFGKYIIIYF